MDSKQFIYTVISDTLDRELDRKLNLESKAMSLFRLWIFLITIFITAMTFLINYNSVAISSLITLNNHWTCALILIFIATSFIFLRLLYLIVEMSSISFSISDKAVIKFDSAKIDSMLTSETSLLYPDVCKSLNYSIEDYRRRNIEIGDAIKKSLPLINRLIISLFVMLLLFTLIITMI